MSLPLGHGVPWDHCPLDPLSSLNPVSPLGGLVSSLSPGATVPWIQRLPPGGPVPPLVLLSPWGLVPPLDPVPSAVLLCPYPLSLGAASHLDLFWCPPWGPVSPLWARCPLVTVPLTRTCVSSSAWCPLDPITSEVNVSPGPGIPWWCPQPHAVTPTQDPIGIRGGGASLLAPPPSFMPRLR